MLNVVNIHILDDDFGQPTSEIKYLRQCTVLKTLVKNFEVWF